MYCALVLVVRIPWPAASAVDNVAVQLPLALAVTTASDCSASLIVSASSRNSSITQLGQALPAPLVPLTVTPAICVTCAGLKFSKGSGRLVLVLMVRQAHHDGLPKD